MFKIFNQGTEKASWRFKVKCCPSLIPHSPNPSSSLGHGPAPRRLWNLSPLHRPSVFYTHPPPSPLLLLQAPAHRIKFTVRTSRQVIPTHQSCGLGWFLSSTSPCLALPDGAGSQRCSPAHVGCRREASPASVDTAELASDDRSRLPAGLPQNAQREKDRWARQERPEDS